MLGSAAWALIPLQLQGERMCGCQLGSLEPSGGSGRRGGAGRPKQVPPLPPTIARELPNKHRDVLKKTEAQWERECACGAWTLKNDTKGDKRLNGSVPGIYTPRPYQRSQRDMTLPLYPVTFIFPH